VKIIWEGKASGSGSGSVKPILKGVDRNRTFPPFTKDEYMFVLESNLAYSEHPDGKLLIRVNDHWYFVEENTRDLIIDLINTILTLKAH
jgi:hypothetical protein